jgi:hypothetical protein
MAAKGQFLVMNMSKVNFSGHCGMDCSTSIPAKAFHWAMFADQE